MAFQYKDVCYPTEALATDAWASNIGHSFVTVSTTTNHYYPEKIDGVWVMCRHSVSTGLTASCYSLNKPVFTSCTDTSDPTSQFLTGLELGSAVASVCVIAYVWRFLRVRF